MSRLEDAKKKYDKTEIPKELSKRVQAAVEESGARKREREKVVRIRRRKVLAGKCAGVAAGLAIVFTTALQIWRPGFRWLEALRGFSPSAPMKRMRGTGRYR